MVADDDAGDAFSSSIGVEGVVYYTLSLESV